MAKSRYINLFPDSAPETEVAEVMFSLDSQVVRLGGKTWGWVWNRPRGIILQRGKEQSRVPIIDFTRCAQAFLYGLSALLVTIGVIKKFAGKGGVINGE